MIDPLAGMTPERWNRMSCAQRDKMRDNSQIAAHPLAHLLGHRVEVVDKFDETRRFIVGKSTGWRPCLLEVKTRRSMGGGPADSEYKTVRDLGRVREWT
jgi:hypothetical protein